jgi:hypothetical protein
MSDEVDDLLRRAMATLDRQVPPGYFDTLADRVAARLDAATDAVRAVEPAEIAARVVDDELARERARRAAVLAPPVASLDAPPGAPGAPLAAPSTEPARKSTWGRHLAIAAGFGLSVAAAVGVMIFITYEQRDRQAGAPVAREATVTRETGVPASDGAPGREMRAPAATSDGGPARPGTAPVTAVPPSAAGAGSAAPSTSQAPAPPTDASRAKVGTSAGKKPTASATKVAPTIVTKGAPAGKSGPEPPPGKSPGKLGTRDNEAREPVLRNAKSVPYSLSKDDFERGMEAVTAQARSCFAGTRGTAALQVTVAPTGTIMRTVVSGDFAGTPVAACLQRAVASATFPPWAGKPQRHTHSYVLSE